MNDTTRISRQFSTAQVMEAIVHGGPVSRASMAKQTGMSKQTISEITRKLETDGWIRETGRTSGHVGRTAITYEIVPDAACIATVDLGGTKIRAAIADLSCRVLGEVMEPTDPRGGKRVIEQINRLCRLAALESKIPFENIKSAVVGVPGVPEKNTGRVLMAPNIADFANIDVQGLLSEALGIEVALENDVNLAVLGEQWGGAGIGLDDVAFIALGTGIGAGIIVGGNLLRGAANVAGEIGFLPIGADPFEAESLRVGAFERAAATVGIKARYHKLTGSSIDVPGIFDLATKGDDHAIEVVRETAEYMARGVAAVCAVTNPARVILGGSIGARDEIVSRVRALVLKCFPYEVDICVSKLGAHAALVGGAAVGLGRLHLGLFSGGMAAAAFPLPPVQVLRVVESGS